MHSRLIDVYGWITGKTVTSFSGVLLVDEAFENLVGIHIVPQLILLSHCNCLIGCADFSVPRLHSNYALFVGSWNRDQVNTLDIKKVRHVSQDG